MNITEIEELGSQNVVQVRCLSGQDIIIAVVIRKNNLGELEVTPPNQIYADST